MGCTSCNDYKQSNNNNFLDQYGCPIIFGLISGLVVFLLSYFLFKTMMKKNMSKNQKMFIPMILGLIALIFVSYGTYSGLWPEPNFCSKL